MMIPFGLLYQCSSFHVVEETFSREEKVIEKTEFYKKAFCFIFTKYFNYYQDAGGHKDNPVVFVLCPLMRKHGSQYQYQRQSV